MRPAPRHLTDRQQEKLLEVLTDLKGQRVGFKFVSMNPEATQFTAQLISIFQGAGWIIEELTEIEDPDVFGVTLTVKSLKDAPPYLQQLHSTLVSFGISAPIALEGRLEPKQLRVQIGHNPRIQ